MKAAAVGIARNDTFVQKGGSMPWMFFQTFTRVLGTFSSSHPTRGINGSIMMNSEITFSQRKTMWFADPR